MNSRLNVLAVCLCLFSGFAIAQTSEEEMVKWQKGPGKGNLGGIAEVEIPEGFVFAGAKDTMVLMTAMKNPTSGNELGFIGPTNLSWFVLYEFDEVGYIKDDEKNSLDADAMLESIKRGTEEGNKDRKKRGWPTMSIVGWEQKPRYNEETHNLEWAIRGESEGHGNVNYNTRLLGRGGVMRITLVTDPESFAATMPSFKTILAGSVFSQGHKYAEFKKGDKMAEYGLSALVVGGAAAVAVKTGAAKGLWKLIVLGAMGVAAFFRKIFGGKKAQEKAQE